MKVILTENQLRYLLELSADDVFTLLMYNTEILDCHRYNDYELCLLSNPNIFEYPQIALTYKNQSILNVADKDEVLSADNTAITVFRKYFIDIIKKWLKKYDKIFVASPALRKVKIYYRLLSNFFHIKSINSYKYDNSVAYYFVLHGVK